MKYIKNFVEMFHNLRTLKDEDFTKRRKHQKHHQQSVPVIDPPSTGIGHGRNLLQPIVSIPSMATGNVWFHP